MNITNLNTVALSVTESGKNTSHSFIYFAAAVLSLVLLVVCCVLVHGRRGWFIALFSSVAVVNAGYTLLSVSGGLQMALMANRIAYLGSVFLPFAMLMIILDVTNTKRPAWLIPVLGVVSITVFAVAASPGFSDIYYKEVEFAVVGGAGTLQKVYGPLHPLYLIYLLGYFAAMTAVIVQASVKKRVDTAAHAIVLLIAVFVNLGVWFIEQIFSIDFEMLSVSYIISELFLLGAHLFMKENERLRRIVKQVESVHGYTDTRDFAAGGDDPVDAGAFSPERIEVFISGTEQLTPTERAIYYSYIARLTTKEIMARMNIKENTLKYHNRNIYGKLGVSSRKELQEMHKHISLVKKKLNETE